MTANIIQIGNSHGIRLPKKLIEQFGLTKVSLEILKDGIFLRPIKQCDISTWDTPELRHLTKQEAQNNDFNEFDIQTNDWKW
ncbi:MULTISPECIES: AbrB/MazE/SpoVT family DNA-binding domain-containing protein [unclassified Campylobacter]|uniref:AbrB/MazE/SpoVT family DNA-binding domain-containing protein n=1 Tax=unclassified Campylobacter TaxID=2593542 RepID=UPI003D33001D